MNYTYAARAGNNCTVSGYLLIPWNTLRDATARYAGLNDENGKKIFVGDICQWADIAWGKCTGVVRYGRWKQDGSGGEYDSTECLGWYLEVSKVQSLMPDLYTDAEAEEEYPEWMLTISLVDDIDGNIKDLAIIGNVFDNPELLEEADRHGRLG